LFLVGPLLTIDQVSESLNVPKSTIRSWIHEQKIPFLKFGEGKKSTVRFDPDTLNQWVLEKSREPKERNQNISFRPTENNDSNLIPASKETLRKYANKDEKEKELKKRISNIVYYVYIVTRKMYDESDCENLKKIILNNTNNNKIAKFINCIVEDIGFKENPSVLDNVTLDDIFSKENWNKFLSKSKRKGVNYSFKKNIKGV